MLHRPGGIYRRRIVLESTPHFSTARLEDDFHHFEVDITHDGARVTAVSGRALRNPWSTCPGASAQLVDFLGQPMETRIIRRHDVTDVQLQCTHQHDLAILAIARAARGLGRTQYDIEVPDRPDRQHFSRVDDGIMYREFGGIDGHCTARLWRDGEPLVTWDLDGVFVRAPAEVAGIDYRKMGKWAEARYPDDDAALEAVKVLRQGIFVSGGRAHDVDLVPTADSYVPQSPPVCHVFQISRVKEARRMKGSTWDFTDRPEALLRKNDKVSDR